jgi:hypothetical protein
MAQTNFTPISLYYSTTAAAVPTAGNLVAGELAINTQDGKLFYKDAAGVVQVLGTKGGVGTSTTTQVLYNSSGLVVGSANMVFDGSTLTTLNTAYTGTLTGGTGIVNLGSGQFYKDASGNVGIGTTAPATDWGGSSLLQVNTASTFSTFVLSSTRTPTDNGRIGSISWEIPTNTSTYRSRAVIEALCNGSTANKFGGTLVFSTAADNTTYPTERMRVLSTGNILSLSGGSTTATGTGIAFPATQSASSDANTLDDYEEGTWTPNQGSGLTVVGAFSSSGRYTKIGRLVYISGRLSGATSIASTSGTQFCTNLPFTVAEASALGDFTNSTTSANGGLAAFGTQIYSTTTVGATSEFDFSVTYTV